MSVIKHLYIVNCFNYLALQLDCRFLRPCQAKSCSVNICCTELNHLWFLFLSHPNIKYCQLLLWIISIMYPIIFTSLSVSWFQILIVLLLLFANYFFQTEVSSFCLCSSWVYVSLWSVYCFPLPAPGTSWPYYMIDYLCLLKHVLSNIIFLLTSCIEF